MIYLMSGSTFLCPYCGLQKPVEERSLEHILPAALGGELTTRNVCHDCNQRAGKEVDAPFVNQFWIREMRHRFEVPDRYGIVPRAPVFPTKLDDGTKVLAILDRAGWRAKLIPSESWHDARTLTFAVDAEDETAAAKKLQRLAKQTGKDVQLVSQVPGEVANPQINLEYEQDISRWPRMGAKIALAIAAERLPPEYLTSPSADWLRGILWGSLSTPAPPGIGVSPHLAGEHVSDPVVRMVCPPPEHQVMLIGLAEGTGLVFTLFGELRYMLRLGPESAEATPGTYLIDPVERKSRWLGWAEWEAMMGDRIASAKEMLEG